jgi:hypothetical protein
MGNVLFLSSTEHCSAIWRRAFCLRQQGVGYFSVARFSLPVTENEQQKECKYRSAEG